MNDFIPCSLFTEPSSGGTKENKLYKQAYETRKYSKGYYRSADEKCPQF